MIYKLPMIKIKRYFNKLCLKPYRISWDGSEFWITYHSLLWSLMGSLKISPIWTNMWKKHFLMILPFKLSRKMFCISNKKPKCCLRISLIHRMNNQTYFRMKFPYMKSFKKRSRTKSIEWTSNLGNGKYKPPYLLSLYDKKNTW